MCTIFVLKSVITRFLQILSIYKERKHSVAKKKNASLNGNYRHRRSFAKIPDVMDMPNLIEVQTSSFEKFKTEGINEAFRELTPIESADGSMVLEFGDHWFEDIKMGVDECKDKDASYQAALTVQVRYINRETGEVAEQDCYMGDFPMMTPRATFIINGTERVVVSQLVRSPGVYFTQEPDKTSDGTLISAKMIPSHGAWLEFETDKRNTLNVRIDRKRKQPATLIVRALGLAQTNDEIIKLLGKSEFVMNTLERDTTMNQEEALIELYKRFRPGEPPTIESARNMLEGLYFTKNRYSLARVGRYKINKKLHDEKNPKCDIELGEGEYISTLTPDDIVKTIKYLVNLAEGNDGYTFDDIDHFGNRRIRTCGELISNTFRTGLNRMARQVRDRMGMLDPADITPTILVNSRPINAQLKDFFGSSPLSQFMDQTNPASGITNKRRLSALGPGGLSRERAGIDVRDVHNSHYGRMCPIETPEGPNIGLIGSLATFGRINEYGFIETPYRRVVDGKVTDDIDYLTADKEEKFTIAQANEQFDQETRIFGKKDENGKFVPSTRVLCRTQNADGEFGEPAEVEPENVDYMDVSPRQMTSVATALIPFLEHDDANRALMGSNMQRQAVPLLRPQAPLVGTGMEHRIAVDSGEILVAQNDGEVDYVDGETIIVKTKSGDFDEYLVPKFKRSNQSGSINHHPVVRVGDKISKGDVLADGPSCDHGELALGQNLMIAYMPWEGYNYEDAIIVSERVVAEDLLTSITIAQHEVECHETKLGDEEITREVPNVSTRAVANLDEEGIVRIGTEVEPGDILVGKVTPKGESDMTAEERLLRAIFGEKARDVRDTSLRVPHGGGGRVIGILHFRADAGDDLKPQVKDMIRVFIAQKRKVQPGDKLSGRHGNKGVISRVLPVEDMPYMADGTPIDVMLNPLGVPSRMNVGQLLENHLGWAAKWGWSDDENQKEPVEGPQFVATPVFDGATEEEISQAILAANKNLMLQKKEEFGDHLIEDLVPQLSAQGKMWLWDGRTGEKFREPITVGSTYILKLGHMVDDKIHARSNGPYSLITQQPLGGKAQFGGQRFGEMEVWALYAYGASNVLQEILTIKSDDVSGRARAYEAIVAGNNIPAPEVPESFKVLVKELKSLGITVELKGNGNLMEMRDDADPRDGKPSVYANQAELELTAEQDAMNAIDDIATDLDDLLSDIDLTGDAADTNDNDESDESENLLIDEDDNEEGKEA